MRRRKPKRKRTGRHHNDPLDVVDSNEKKIVIPDPIKHKIHYLFFILSIPSFFYALYNPYMYLIAIGFVVLFYIFKNKEHDRKLATDPIYRDKAEARRIKREEAKARQKELDKIREEEQIREEVRRENEEEEDYSDRGREFTDTPFMDMEFGKVRKRRR
tara:strand:+ start:962 stop:1438 length:477 start_codon:yes stop_codon:yes gene_type:complete